MHVSYALLHGIGYFRNINILPSVKRRELGTRSKTEATTRSLRFADSLWPIAGVIGTTLDIIQTVQAELSLHELILQAEQYVEFKSSDVYQRDAVSTKRCVSKCFNFTVQILKCSKAA